MPAASPSSTDMVRSRGLPQTAKPTVAASAASAAPVRSIARGSASPWPTTSLKATMPRMMPIISTTSPTISIGR